MAVTIIVLLVLSAITITFVLGEDGILNKAKEAENAMNSATINDQEGLNSISDTINVIVNDIGKLVDNGTIKIGDYVAYTPKGAESYTVNGTYSGTENNQIIDKENLNWRVLDKTEDGKVRLISANPTKAKVELKGANGYNNAVYLLDELCNTLYKGTNAIAKSLKIEDIQNKMDLRVWNYNNANNYDSTYNPTSKSYPLIFEQEEGQIVNDSSGNLGVSEQTNILTGIGIANTWKVKYIYWNKNMEANNYKKPIYHELFHKHATEMYWLSSRCIKADSPIAFFDVRYINSNNVETKSLYNSNGSENSITYHIRPVVSIDSNVGININKDKDGSTPEKAWIIK